MLEVAAARETVLRHARPLPPEPTRTVLLDPGQVLAEDVRADLDSPPFAKSLRDGYAVRAADFAGGVAELRVIEEIAAGSVPKKRVGPGEAAVLYTGAPIPDGADAVVMKERAETIATDRVRLTEPAVRPGLWVLPRAAEMRAGDVAMPAGTVLDAAGFGVLATVGRTSVLARPRPKVGVLATGNEVVEADAAPGPGQIRNSNGPMLTAQARTAGADAGYLGIGRDDPGELRSRIREGLRVSDVLLLSGGVSVGKFDLVPDILADLGVAVHFHQIRMKPGKPLLFGTHGDTLVFGLPGNPVSAFVCFELFVRPALRRLGGRPDAPPTRRLPLAAPLKASNDRPTFHPARLVPQGVQPVEWFGSADLRALLGVNAFLALPQGDVDCSAGDVVEVIEL